MEEGTILDIEKEALEMLLDERKKQKMSQSELGKKAFPNSVNPLSKINAMYHMKASDNKPLRLRLGDYCAMCRALGVSPIEKLAIIIDGKK